MHQQLTALGLLSFQAQQTKLCFHVLVMIQASKYN